MSAIPTHHGPAHEDCLVGYAIGLEADLRREDDIRDLVARCDECLGFGYRTLADMRALAGGDARAGARLEQLLQSSVEAIAWRDHTVAYARLYGGVTSGSEEPERSRRWLSFGSLGVIAIAVILIAVLTSRATTHALDEGEATIEVIQAGLPGEPKVRPLTPPADTTRDQLLRMRMPTPGRAIGSAYLWIGVLTDGRNGRPLVLTAQLPEDAAAAIRAGVPWNQELHVPGDDRSTGAIGAVRAGEMAIVLPSRLLNSGTNHVRIIAATSDPGSATIDALTSGTEAMLPKEVEGAIVSRPLEIRVISAPPVQAAEPKQDTSS